VLGNTEFFLLIVLGTTDTFMLISVWRTMLCLWLASVLFVISLPWSSFDATPHWKNVQWIPFTHLNLHPAVLIEAALNLVAFIPVGYLAVRSLPPGAQRPFLLVSLLGFCSSVSIEVYQLFCHGRVPSTSDILMNVAGTEVGVWFALAIDQILTFCMVRIRSISA
jgi:glycopeptide antibiotics resistance protein